MRSELDPRILARCSRQVRVGRFVFVSNFLGLVVYSILCLVGPRQTGYVMEMQVDSEIVELPRGDGRP